MFSCTKFLTFCCYVLSRGQTAVRVAKGPRPRTCTRLAMRKAILMNMKEKPRGHVSLTAKYRMKDLT